MSESDSDCVLLASDSPPPRAAPPQPEAGRARAAAAPARAAAPAVIDLTADSSDDERPFARGKRPAAARTDSVAQHAAARTEPPAKRARAAAWTLEGARDGAAAASAAAAGAAAAAGGAASDVIDLTGDDDVLTAALHRWGDVIDLTSEAAGRPRLAPLPARPPRVFDLSGLDVLAEHRARVRAFLAAKATQLDIVDIRENQHSKPGNALFTRFITAWASAADTSVSLVFHGTPEANVDTILKEGLDPKRRSGQAMGPGEYFAEEASISVAYCRGGRKLLVFAVLTDKAGITARANGVLVVHRPDYQLPLFVVTYRPKPQMQAAVLGGMMPLLRNAFPPALMAHVQGLQAAGPAGAAALAALLGSVPSLAGMFGPPPPPGGAAAGGGFSGFAPFAFPGAAMAPFAPGMPLNGRGWRASGGAAAPGRNGKRSR